MTKKEIAEVKKTLKAENCCIDKLCACYVTTSKEKTVIPIGSLFSCGEDEIQKYLNIFKQSVSGSIGKQLHCLEFPLDAEKEGETQNLLYNLEKSGLDDQDMVEQVFDQIIECYETEDNFCILIMHANYDIISKNSDDDSEEVYSHIICSICPVSHSKPLLAYNHDENKLQDSESFMAIQPPKTAFLFPALTDRSPNIHEVLVFNKKASSLDEGIISRFLGCSMPNSADEQISAFCESVKASFADDISYEQAAAIHEDLYEKSCTAESDEDLILTPDTVKQVLQQADAKDLDAFEKKYEEMIGDGNLFLENIAGGKYVIKMVGITITANEDARNLISVMEDGRGGKCLAIRQNGEINVNGIEVKHL